MRYDAGDRSFCDAINKKGPADFIRRPFFMIIKILRLTNVPKDQATGISVPINRRSIRN